MEWGTFDPSGQEWLFVLVCCLGSCCLGYVLGLTGKR